MIDALLLVLVLGVVQRLADLIDAIVHPRADVIVPMAKRKR
jgi:hypothetical protein